jgi:hypothetical protein
MHPLLARIPFVRRAFYERDVARQERDRAICERDIATEMRDRALGERDAIFDALQEISGRTAHPGQRDPHPGGVQAKVFCIGMGKTGTTSLEAFFKQLGFVVGNQSVGESLLEHWAARNFDPIIGFVNSAQVFQDIPFCLPFTFSALDRAFPDAKFILSVRDDPEEWYSSLVRFTTNLVGKGRVPTADDLRTFHHRSPGWIFHALKLIYGVSEEDPFEKSRLIQVYETHNETVRDYFRHRAQSLLTIKLADPEAAQKIMNFLGMPYRGEIMPHLNRSREPGACADETSA